MTETLEICGIKMQLKVKIRGLDSFKRDLGTEGREYKMKRDLEEKKKICIAESADVKKEESFSRGSFFFPFLCSFNPAGDCTA